MQQSMTTAKTRRGGTRIQRWRVPLGFACAALFVVLARPRWTMLVVGGAVSVIGLLLRAWAAGHIRKNDALNLGTLCPYTQPTLSGQLFVGPRFYDCRGALGAGIVFIGLFLGIYLPVMRVEASTLARLFGESYVAYARAVPLFLPRLTPYRNGDERKSFDAQLYFRYREYRATLGLLIAWGLLVLKSYYLK